MAKQLTPQAQPTPMKPQQAPAASLTGGKTSSATATPQKLIPKEEEIRFRAYLKWEAAGTPAGDGSKFWLEAERELRAAK